MTAALDWDRDGANWPGREHSQRVKAGGLVWHVQIFGKGPPLLLVHGTGASCHSWRRVAPHLADSYTVIMPDLPGHGFSGSPTWGGFSLPSVAEALARLLDAVELTPLRVAGHSAGSAILVRMVIDQRLAPDCLVSFNGAFFPISGVAGNLFSPLAKLLALNPLVPWVFSKMANERSVGRLIADTGSVLDAESLALYCKLIGNHGHASGALSMMAAWELESLVRDLPRLDRPLYLVKATNDRTVPPSSADRAAELAPLASVITLANLGHLAHEENPALAAEMIMDPARFVVTSAQHA
jgi:magnesium chelatase accessory protein